MLMKRDGNVGEGCRTTCWTEMTAWAQIGWQRLGYTEGKAETCWYRRMMYNFLKLMCSSLKSFGTCLRWLPLLIQHPDSPVFISNMYFCNQMVLACILKENNMKNTRRKKPKTVLTGDTQLRYFNICNIWKCRCSFTQMEKWKLQILNMTIL